jgi:thiol-disulfide isomerase/thioredoxin
MIGRFVVSFCILITALSGVAIQRAQDPRPRLIYFKASWCGQCHQFKAAAENDPCFSQALKRQYNCLPAVDFDLDRELAEAWQVERLPTFIVIDADGRELNRVVGFTGANKLLQELAQRPQRAQRPRTREPDSNPPRQPDPPANDDAAEVRRANDALRRQLDQQRDLIDVLKRDSAAAEKRNRELLAQLKAQLERLNDQPTRPGAAEATESPETSQPRERPPDHSGSGRVVPDGGAPDEVGLLPGIVPTLSQPAEDLNSSDDESRDDGHGLFGSLVSAAVSIGLTSAQAEVFVPVAAAAGPVGAAAAAGLYLINRRRKRKRNSGATSIGGGRRIEDHRDGYRTEFRDLIQVVDYEGRAWAEALKLVADVHTSNPAALAVLKQLGNVAKQIIHGEQVERRSNDGRPKQQH